MVENFRIEYLPIAQEDLNDIIDYIQKDNPDAAKSFADRLDKAVSNLARFPKSGHVPNDERLQNLGYRMLVIDKYLVFYFIKENLVEIRRIIHGSRRYSFLL
ncbi:MAG TPA: type II toxin-antitoxin system RelE/ParE family toxin [Candidatus Lokiarchaeia archaeon]|nr:type II toxin-antitoxin system RelE/ParE family toxin [Candidatus Lokiarchaeia archaeon]